MFSRILKAFDVDLTDRWVKVPVKVETLYGEIFIGMGYTKRPLILKNHCHENKASFNEICEIELATPFPTIKRLNKYMVTTQQSKYQVELDGKIYIQVDNQTIEMEAFQLKSLAVLESTSPN